MKKSNRLKNVYKKVHKKECPQKQAPLRRKKAKTHQHTKKEDKPFEKIKKHTRI